MNLFIFASVKKRLLNIILLCFLLAMVACGGPSQHASEVDFQEAQIQYDSGFVLSSQDSLLVAFPHFIRVAEKLEYLPDDMTAEEMLLASRAYYQMAHIFGRKMENNAEIDALRWALNYQKAINDTVWMARTGWMLASAFETVSENDSAQFHLYQSMPYLDTISDDVQDYIGARNLLASLYFDNNQIDSCLQVQREIIAFKVRRDMDTKGDSVNMGMNLFFSGRKTEAKPYLFKILDMECDDVEKGAVMSLLAQVYEEEQNSDSSAFCQSFQTSYVQAESERVSDGLLAVKQYEQYKAERDARLAGLRAQKATQKAKVWHVVYVVVALLLLAAIAFVIYHRRYRRRMNQEHEVIRRDLQEARGTLETKALETLFIKAEAIYNDRFNNKAKRILKVFDESYPDALTRLKAAHPNLNETELDVCVLSYFPFRTKEIADILDLRENTISKYRSNIKKKTQADSFEVLWNRFIA
ncbi:MAG: response regulator transcription factor [Bacteroidales bacterium]|nr:response regulator transcription factor [Bacteroidales bacterium]